MMEGVFIGVYEHFLLKIDTESFFMNYHLGILLFGITFWDM